ncbi:MAG: DUF262 domain-containing HNH endonuclease family protein [Desulfotomaculum sp.]|nr:DUF262 domain-containing HNH endonuclease family protein [Desulfotomaculum sp.]
MGVNSKPQTMDSIFGHTKYYIDFYQREYKWEKQHVESLLEDIFYKFEEEYNPDIDVNLDNISKFGWYYLNTYVTNQYSGKTYIVDGQQRFTTLTLILIKLYHISEKTRLQDKTDWIKNRIYGTGAEGKSFWMGAHDRTEALDDLLNNGSKTKDSKENISIKNIYKNFKHVSDYLDKKFKNQENNYNKHKFEAFLLFFMKQINFIEILIDDSKDVAMVFEVINDRGEKLKPYEVFKGELIGQLDKSETNNYYNIWKEHIGELTNIDEKEADNFFRFYFRSKYVDKEIDYKDFDKEYNKVIFSKKFNSIIGLKRNPQKVKQFMNKDFKYYSKLYAECLRLSKSEGSSLFFNDLNDQDRQLLLILSAIKLDDPEKKEKIETIAFLFDRHHVLLQIFGCYDSNKFTKTIIALNKNIRERSIEEIKEIFKEQLLKEINEIKNMSVKDLFQYSLFRDTGTVLNIRFIRYFFAKIDHFIAENINQSTDNYYDMVRNTGHVNGYHIEHILAKNKENKMVFNNNEEQFDRERNRLGALLILKGSDNISSSNETYDKKLKTYSHGMLWGRTLIEEFYHNNPDFSIFCKKYNLSFKPIKRYDAVAIEERQKLLFELVKLIWGEKALVLK